MDNDALLFCIDCIEQIMLDMRVKDEISPTLRTIVNLFDESNKRPTDVQLHGQNSAEDLDSAFDNENSFDHDDHDDNCMGWGDDHDDQTVVADLGCDDADPSFPCYPQVLFLRNIYDCLE